MPFLEILIVAFALAADAFTVGVVVGLTHRNPRQIFRLSFHFGLFQALLPLFGAFAGSLAGPWFGNANHWISFGLLQAIGLKMLYESFSNDEMKMATDPTRGLSLIGLSLAVSIDALAVGFSLGLSQFSIWVAILIIGIVAALVTLGGMLIAGKLASKIGQRVEPFAAVALMLLGVKMLLSGL